MERRQQRGVTAQSHHWCPKKAKNNISFPVSLNRSIDFSQLKYHLVVLKQTPGILVQFSVQHHCHRMSWRSKMWQSPARDLGNSQQFLNKGAWKAPKALEAGCTVQEWNHYVFVCLYFYSLSVFNWPVSGREC